MTTFNISLEGIQTPYKNLDNDKIKEAAMDGSLKSIKFINEDMLLNKTVIVDRPNPDIYVDKEIDNLALNKYYQNLFNKLNLSIHYIENSPIKEMSAVSIFVP